MLLGMPLSVVALLLVNTGIELGLSLADHGVWGDGWWRAWAYGHLAFWADLLHGAGQLYAGQTVAMFVTYGFLHGGILHLVVNMFALFSFGVAIVDRIGQKRFLAVYLGSTIGGAAGYALLTNAHDPMVGASGALFGLLGVWVCWDYLDRRFYGDPLWVTARALVFIVLYNVVFWVLLSGRLAWETHLGGFVVGWALAVFWGRPVHRQSRVRRARQGSERG